MAPPERASEREKSGGGARCENINVVLMGFENVKKGGNQIFRGRERSLVRSHDASMIFKRPAAE
jgi:hypothetical protein